MDIVSQDSFGYLIWQISKSWVRLKQRTLNEFGVTGPQVEMLGAIYALSKKKKEVKQIDISQAIRIDPMTTSTILRNLEKKKFVKRQLSEVDTRARVVELTPAGTRLFEEACYKSEQIQEEIFATFDKETLISQMTLLLNLLERLNEYKN